MHLEGSAHENVRWGWGRKRWEVVLGLLNPRKMLWECARLVGSGCRDVVACGDSIHTQRRAGRAPSSRVALGGPGGLFQPRGFCGSTDVEEALLSISKATCAMTWSAPLPLPVCGTRSRWPRRPLELLACVPMLAQVPLRPLTCSWCF